MDCTIYKIISESNKSYKRMNDIPNELKFILNKSISGNESKLIPITLENVRKKKNIWVVHDAGLLWLWDIAASHFAINQHYVKNFQEDFRPNEIPYETSGADYKTKYYIKIYFTLPQFSEKNIINHWYNIDSWKDNNLRYTIIIGEYLMDKLSMIFDFNNKNLIWEDIIVPMWRSGDNCPKPTSNRY